MEGQSSSNKKKKRNNDLLNTPLLEQQTSSEFKSSSNASHDVAQELFNSNKKGKKSIQLVKVTIIVEKVMRQHRLIF